jgi:hypothetical protein
VIDLTKYADKKIPKDVKEILYRPPKVKNLYDKYWQLAKVCENLEKTEFDREILKDHKPRFPRKSADEIKLIDQIMSRLEALIEEDTKNLSKEVSAASSELMSELGETTTKSKLYYEGGNVEALEKWRALSEHERQSQKSKNDEIDAEKTDDLD